MNPFPKTPTPGKFLPSRRSTQSSQTPGGPPRFTPTPRFGASSTRAGVDIIDDDDEEDEDEDEEESDLGYGSEEEEEEERAGYGEAGDAIDVSEPDWALPLGREREEDGMRIEGSESEEDRGSTYERDAKRRKVSISPASEAGSSPLRSPREADHESTRSGDGDATWDSSGSESQDSLNDDLPGGRIAQQQPIFHRAPRFKPVEADDALGGLDIPAALFSPQGRKGAKYLAGGLASRLQGWLSEVKGWESSDRDATSEAVSLRIYAESVGSGRRMGFLEGRVISDEAHGETMKRKFLLAGEGRLTGLGERTEVKEGSVVVAGQPMWDVEVDGQCWTVACDWGVEP